MTRRIEYLEKIWQDRFPPAGPDRQGLLRGRVGLISHGRLELISAGGSQSLHYDEHLILEEGFAISEVIERGDIVEVQLAGARMISSVRLLVPTRGASPFSQNPFGADRARQWQDFLGQVREFFSERGFFELRTPTLVPSPGLEPFLDPFETTFRWGSDRRDFFLPTSPEFHLKKALTLGFEKCFEFKECFRNGELGATHQPEFLMLEWYRAYATNDALIDDIRHLCAKLAAVSDGKMNSNLDVIDMPVLWQRFCDFKLSPHTTLPQLQDLARALGLSADENDFDDLFARIFLEKIEPGLAALKNPIVIRYYPPSQAALARITREGWADRFELYWSGLEIANAFHELNDSHEQRRRFKKDQEKKKKLGKTVVPVDEEFLKALDWGMPPSAGIALGLDRLFMALTGIREIGETRLFPLKD